MPENTVTAIAQTHDGYLWLATFNGLARFDGIRFVVFDAANTPALKSSRIQQLYLDAHGRLWIISEFGDLAQFAGGRFTSFGTNEGLAVRIHGVHEDAHGRLWAEGPFHPVGWLNGGKFVPGLNTNWVVISSWPTETSFSQTNRDEDWNRNKAVFRPGTVPRVNFAQRREFRALSTHDGGFWIVTDCVQKYRDGQWERVMAAPEPIKIIGSLCEDRTGNLWVGTWEQGLLRFSPEGEVRQFKLTANATHWPIRAICEDREGNLWIGSGGDGLRRFKRPALLTYDNATGLKSDVVRSVAEDRSGRLWVCNLGGIDWLQPAQVDRKSPSINGVVPSDLLIPIPSGLLADRDGTMWIGSYSDGIFRHRAGVLSDVNFEGVAGPPGPVNVVFLDRKGIVFAGTTEGLFEGSSGALRRVQLPNARERSDVRAMAEDKFGNLFVGLNGGGLLCRSTSSDATIQTRQWAQFIQENGLSENHVWCLYVDGNDTVWIGTVGKGLTRFKDGKFFNFTAPELLLPRLITCILEDDFGRLWLGSNQGIFRVDRDQLNAFADGGACSVAVVHYGKTDGMGSSECVGGRQPTACKTRDGRLWFATVKGLSVIDPRNLACNTHPPPVVVEEVLADGERIFTESRSTIDEVTIPTGKSRVEVHFAGLSFAAPEKVRFKFRLDGFDKDWIDAGTRRTAHYTRLAPRKYTFRVIAANSDGVWNEAGAVLGLTIVPAWWQTAWVQVSVPFSAAFLVVAAGRRRVRRLQRARVEQEKFSRQLISSQEQERQRIAAELHDGLGQTLLVIKSQAILAARQPDVPAGTKDRLDQLSQFAGEAISEVRSMAQHLRPFYLDQLGLTRAVRGMLTQVARTAEMNLLHDLADIDSAFPADQEINFFRIVQELLNNVIKHAQARDVRVLVERTGHEVRLRVEDNGCGFATPRSGDMESAEADPQLHGFGLRNITERVKIMHGRWKIHSMPGQGTTVEIVLPAQAFDSCDEPREETQDAPGEVGAQLRVCGVSTDRKGTSA